MGVCRLKSNNDQYYLIIQFRMSKKVPQPKEVPKPVLDEETEPFLRTLQKKVRNINKKLTQITELEAKENLKPEQVEKIARKNALIEERTRVEETATLFRESYVENIAVYRAAQLKELETVARAVVLFHSGVKLVEGGKLASLWETLKGDSQGDTINAAITSLSAALKSFADDKKLQKSLSTFVEVHGNEKIERPVVKEEKVEVAVSEVKSEPAKEAEPVTVVQTEAKAVSEAKVEEKTVEVPHTHTSVEAVYSADVKIESAPEKAEKVEAPIAEAKVEEVAKEGNGRRDNRGGNRETRGGDRDNRDNRGRGERGRPRGDYRRRENEQPRERRQYKPKNDEREPEVREAREESHSSDSEPEVREFRKEEIRKLEDDGFIVVGKAKPKAKDPKEVRSAHDREHGKKHHHHHGPAQNY